MSEYEEIIGNKLSPQVATAVIRMLSESENVSFVNIYFNYNLIDQNPDDNKFVNCAINANAHFIVTHDKHFNVLSKIHFPLVRIIDVNKLQQLLISS